MWSNPRPPSRSSGDHYNNNTAPANPYSRTAAVTKTKQGRQSTDPWDWGTGWEDNTSGQQDEWNNGWSQTPAPVPNVIPNHPPSLYHQKQPEKKAHGTPDLIPEKVNNFSRGGGMMQLGQQQQYNQVSNASDFFENIDLVAQNHGTPSLPPMYNTSQVRQPHPPPQNYPVFQPLSSHNTMNRHPSPASYFRPPQPVPPQNNESFPYYQQPPPPAHTPNNMFQNTQYYQPEVNNQTAPELSNNYYEQNKLPTQESTNYYDHHKPNTQEQSGYYDQNKSSTQPYTSYYDQNAIMNSSEPSYESAVQSGTNLSVEEVENVEIAPPERVVVPANQVEISRVGVENSMEISRGHNLRNAEETSVPDNQETVPDNEEHLQNLPQKLSQMKINSTHNLDAWNTSPGWENQEVAPRCELDRNQYLETGQLVDSNQPEETPPEVDNNDEGEALPPPGLHRMVTGQGTESLSHRSVLGQLPSSSGGSFVRLVPGQPTPSASPEPMSLERMVPGQQNLPDHRMVPGHQAQDSQRFSSHQDSSRLVPGQNEPPIQRMVPGQLSDDENTSTDFERMIPGGTSEHENSFPRDDERSSPPDDERTVPGGMSDDSRSQSISMDDDSRSSSQRMMPRMTTEGEGTISPPQSESQSERMVTGAGSMDVLDPSTSVGSQEGTRLVMGHGIDAEESIAQPPLGLHRLVLGQINSEPSTDTEHTTAKTTERNEEKPGGNPPGMQRMVVGQFREKETDTENDKDKETVKSNDRDDDSDSDYTRSERRRHRHRKDSYDDERKERDYSSDREYRGKREDRREYRKKRDNSYNRSPEYRSDHEDYDRVDFRERRERERRDRPRDRDRRRRSPDPYYREDPYYRDDPRRLPPRERDRRYYEPYEDDPYYYRENRSRPSSRSGSEYRRHRDYPPRQPYYPEPGGMGNYMHYYQIQQYYENMRRTDPAAYALWYERYMAEKFGSASNDRASVHSGRSSANEHSQSHEKLNSRRKFHMSTPYGSPARKAMSRSLAPTSILSHNWSFTSLPDRLEEEDREGVKADDTVSHRSTPPLYTSAHIRGQFNSLGQLVVVHPHDPFSYGHHQATVTVCKVSGPNAADTPDTLEFLSNPGPFISGVTHKNTVLQYLKKQRDQFTHSSERLLYDLIRLVIKLNGVVDMTDVADLLMESYRDGDKEGEWFPETTQTVDNSPPLSPHQITSRFRELLLEGNKTEALEWAMKNKDWGHALFLASKMDSRTHNNVMLRFANGLQNNDPLQTLYQLMSGREPQAATCAADKKWGDWRPHLAMMLSNRTANVELDRKAILTLGDSLGTRGRLHAAHFCYLTAQLEFSNYSDRQPKLVLLGSSPDKPFAQFATCRAIMLTLSYEYAKQLSNRDWCIPSLRPYKFLLACTLFDHGNLPSTVAYLESLAQEIVRLPSRDDRPLAQLIIDMADKVKCADSTLAFTSDPGSDPDWLARLKLHVEEANDPHYLSPHLTHGVSTSTVSDLEVHNGGEHVAQPVAQEVSLNQMYTNSQFNEMNNYQLQNQLPGDPNAGYTQDYHDQPQNSYYDPNQNMPPQDLQGMQGYNLEPQSPTDNSSSPEYHSVSSGGGWESHGGAPLPVQQHQTDFGPADNQPQISVNSGYGYFARSEENIKPQVEKTAGPAAGFEKSENKDKSKRRTNKTQSGSGWFGGIWDKLALRPKNQMILPDDKNPPIVWDEKTKKWVNTDASEEEQTAQLKPPPKASELNGSAVPAPAAPPVPAMAPSGPTGPAPTTAPSANSGLPPPAASSTNKYKMQRGKGMRSNYVDIMGSSKKPASGGANPQAFAPMPQAPVTNFFVPAPVSGNDNASLDFLSPSGPVSFEASANKSDDQPPPLSRSSSASSLSREVTFYMSRRQSGAPSRSGGYGKGNPAFFNPSHYQS